MEWKPRASRLFVFSIPERNRFKESGLYSGMPRRGFLQKAQPVWVISHGPGCKEKWARGQKVFIADGFELEPVDLDLWGDYAELPEFKELKEELEACEGKIRTDIITEGSILGIAEEAITHG